MQFHNNFHGSRESPGGAIFAAQLSAEKLSIHRYIRNLVTANRSCHLSLDRFFSTAIVWQAFLKLILRTINLGTLQQKPYK